MAVHHPFIDKLQALSGTLVAGVPVTVEDQQPAFRVTADVAEATSLAAELQSIRFTIPRTADWSLDRLRELAKGLAERVQYLLEPLSVVETDPESATVQLRSTQPAQLDDGRAYYEILARPETLHLCRYQTRQSASREPVSMLLTYEQLSRLLTDVALVSAAET